MSARHARLPDCQYKLQIQCHASMSLASLGQGTIRLGCVSLKLIAGESCIGLLCLGMLKCFLFVSLGKRDFYVI